MNVSNVSSIDASSHAAVKTNKWLYKYSKVLVLLCMLSGDVTSSLKVVNSNAFGLPAFNMGLAKYKQDRTVRHRLWLTIALENIPQIVISLLYATQLAGFDNTVLAALLSSISSVILALLSAFLEYPKSYYIYQMGIKLDTAQLQNPNLRASLKMTKTMAKSICKSMDRDNGFIIVENVYFDGNDLICFHIVSNEIIDQNKQDIVKLVSQREKSIMDGLFENKLLQIKCKQVFIQFLQHENVSLCPNTTTMVHNEHQSNDQSAKSNDEILTVASIYQPSQARIGSTSPKSNKDVPSVDILFADDNVSSDEKNFNEYLDDHNPQRLQGSNQQRIESSSFNGYGYEQKQQSHGIAIDVKNINTGKKMHTHNSRIMQANNGDIQSLDQHDDKDFAPRGSDHLAIFNKYNFYSVSYNLDNSHNLRKNNHEMVRVAHEPHDTRLSHAHQMQLPHEIDTITSNNMNRSRDTTSHNDEYLNNYHNGHSTHPFQHQKQVQAAKKQYMHSSLHDYAQTYSSETVNQQPTPKIKFTYKNSNRTGSNRNANRKDNKSRVRYIYET